MKDDGLLIHTGWLTEAGDNSERFLATAPGISVAAAEFRADKGVTAVGADTWAIEVVPAEQPEEMFPAHQVLLARHGVFLLENIQTAQLVQDQVDEFLFVLGVPRLEGSVQAVINPVAID